MKPVVLCIMDGMAINEEIYGNAFKQAHTPNFDYLWQSYPHCVLEASGEAVGLPSGQMGNSEVGHMNIGAGRVVYQSLQLINERIKDGSFFENKELLSVIDHVKKNNSKLQLFGLLSDGGIHSHINHILATLELAKKEGIKDVYFHAFLDGRDTLPKVALTYLKQLQEKMDELGLGSIATISGRYYAMDRDNRWERTSLAYNAIVNGLGEELATYEEVIDFNYSKGIADEFVIPAVLDKAGMIESGDGLILCNFRPDRSRQLFASLTNESFDSFERTLRTDLKLVTMMKISKDAIHTPAFALEELTSTFGEVVSKAGLRQLRIAETEKYPHVTYFFDGGLEVDYPGKDQILIPSPKVATYDLKPEMSAYEITEALITKIEENSVDVVILNFANGDMVGHTGDFEATKKAVETVDTCIGKLYQTIKEKNGVMLVTADHGNADVMLDKDGNVVTSHSTNVVPMVITKEGLVLSSGKLGDIAPTMLSLLGIEIPKEMSGNNLIK